MAATPARMSWPIGLASLAALALGARLAYIWALGDFVGADEAVGGLMAIHIAQGREFPILLWEAHYAGTLISYLAAILFRFLEPSPFTLRLAALPLTIGGVLVIADAGRRLWGAGGGFVAGLWLALAPPLLFAFSTQAVGGYPEILLFGGLVLWLGVRMREAGDRTAGWRWGLLGLAAGFGSYCLAFVIPIFAGTVWALHRREERISSSGLRWLGGGFLVGFSPYLVYNILHPGASLLRVGGRVLDVSRAEMFAAPSLVALALAKGIGYLGRLLRFPSTLPPNGAVFLGLPMGAGAPLAALIVLAVIVWMVRPPRGKGAPQGRGARAHGEFGPVLLASSTLATLLFLWLLDLDRTRHLLPFYPMAALGLAALWAHSRGRRQVLAGLGIGLLLINQALGLAAEARQAGPSLAPLIQALRARAIRHVYTDYFIGYPLVFLSREGILASPVAGPANVERYPPYTRAVAASPRPAYIFRRASDASAIFAAEMRRLAIPFTRTALEAFDLYVPDRHVRPDELSLPRQY